MAIHSRHSFACTLFYVFVFLLARSAIARPILRQSHIFSSNTQLLAAQANDLRNMESIQVSNLFRRNATEPCPTTTWPKAAATSDAASSHAASLTTAPSTITSPTPTPNIPVSISLFVIDSDPTSTADESTTSSDPLYPNAAATPDASSQAPFEPTALSPSSPPSASSSPSIDPFISTAQSHLSSLPIFLGAFGGIAGLALLAVAVKVYRPLQRVEGGRRLRFPAFLNVKKRLVERRQREGWGGGGAAGQWQQMSDHDSEKLVGSPQGEAYTPNVPSSALRSSWSS